MRAEKISETLKDKPENILISSATKRSFKSSESSLFSAKNRPVTVEDFVSIGTKKGIKIPLAEILKEFSTFEQKESATGLVVMTKRIGMANQEEIASREKQIRKEQVESYEYFDFPPELVKRIIAKHKSKSINLYSGQKEQFVNYLATLLNEIGFDKENNARKFLGQYINGNIDIETLTSGIEHPISKIKQKKLGVKEKTAVSLKEYKENAPTYERLSLLLMPNLWQEMGREQKLQLLSGLRMILELTENENDIRAGELFLRAAEIADSDDKGIREAAYGLLDAVSYEKIPQKTKGTAAQIMTKNNEYSSGLAFSLLCDKNQNEKITEMQKMYKKFEGAILEELSVKREELVDYSAEEWLALLEKVKRLNIVGISEKEMKNNNVGLEIEIVPFDGAPDRAVKDLNDYDGRGSLLSHGRDGDCFELRSRIGGLPFTKTVFYSLQNACRQIRLQEPGWVDSVHFHIDEEAVPAKDVREFFLEAYVNDEKETHEIRSLPSPVEVVDDGKNINKSQYKVDIVKLGNMAAFCASLDNLPKKELDSNKIGIKGLSLEEAIRKVYIINALGDSPIERATVINIMRDSPIFFNLEKALLLAIEHRGLNESAELMETISKMVYEKYYNSFLDILAEHGGEAGAKFAISKFDEIESTDIKDQIIRSLAEHGGEAGAKFAISKFDEIENLYVKDQIKKMIIRKFAKNDKSLVDMFKQCHGYLKIFLEQELRLREIEIKI